jgi:beta-lactam-binding protein with PASTA domain
VEEETERSSKVATIAIIACAVVAVIAIVICIFAISNGAKNNMIQVPYLLGMTQEEAEAVPDISIKVGDRRESSQYPAGQIISQTPAAGGQIAKGGQITVTISLGSSQKTAIMTNLFNYDQEDAINYLIGQGLNLNIEPKKESSGSVDEGKVTRTLPAPGETLTEGQTVYLYVSSGPDVRIEKVPKVKGLDVQLARSQLNGDGFENIELEMVDSAEEKNTVVDISVTEGEMMDVNTEIILYISNGKGTDDPIIDPTLPVVDPDLVSAVVTIYLPEGSPMDYILDVWQGETLVEKISIPADTISRDVELTGKGVMTFEFRVGSTLVQEVTVDFDQYKTEEPTVDSTTGTGTGTVVNG